MAASSAPIAAAPVTSEYVVLTADESTRIKSLLDRLIAAGIVFEPLGDLEADHADVELEIAGSAPLVSVRVLRKDLERARAVEAEWLREVHPDATTPLPLEGNGTEACPSCDAVLTREAERCAACGFELPRAEASS